MQKTQLKELLSFLDQMEQDEPNLYSVLAIKTIKIKIYSMLLDERKQIEAAYNNGKLNSTGDGNMYYFMNYVSND
jgi:hypothetical protein